MEPAISSGKVATNRYNRRSLNGETHLAQARYLLTEFIGLERRTRGTETSKYPEEKKSTEIPLVAASERGPALKLCCG